MSEDKDSVLRRVQKLLAIANDDRADPNEAAAAAKMAEKVMRKYQIEHADVVRRELESGDNMSTQDCTVIMKRDLKGKGEHIPKKVPQWGQWLGVSIAKLFDCQARLAVDARGSACIRFLGYASDVQVAAWTFDYLVGQTISAIRAYQKGASRSKAESESFRRGFVLAVNAMLQSEANKKREEMSAAVTSRALMVVKQQAVDKHFGEAAYREKKGHVKVGEADAYWAGRVQGSKVQMRQGVRANDGNGQLRLEA